mgnify:CR=1 FL=1
MRNAFALTASLLLVGSATLPAHAQWGNYGYNGSDGDIVRCESRDGRTSRCNAYGGDAQLVRQLSDSACIRNRTWGVDYQGLWVSGGCRAEFRVLSGYNDGYYGNDYGYGNDYYGNDYGYGGNYGYGNDGAFRCESKDGRTAHCNSYGTARLVRQLSDSPCIQGRTWGADSRGVWVSGGCRAIFQSGYANGYYGNGAYGNGIVRCESRDNRSRTCNLNAGRRGDVRLVRQLSGKPCIEGRTWGYSGNSVWVTQGCRAEFGVTRNGGRGNNGGWQRPPGDLGDDRPPGAYLRDKQEIRQPVGQPGGSPGPGMPGGDRPMQAQRPSVADVPPPGQIEEAREQPAPRNVAVRASRPAEVVRPAEAPGQASTQTDAPAAREHPRLRERQEQAGEPGQVTP